MRKTLRLTLVCALISLPGLLPGRALGQEVSGRPNVVLVITDDQGYGDLGCHGNPVIKTPNLDALWRESVRLTDYHVDPTCSPTRSALMTGRSSIRTGVWHTILGRSILRKDEVTLANVFKNGGYATAIFGKWHLGDNVPSRPQDKGFDEVLVHGGGGVGQTPDYWGNDYFDDTYFHNGEPKKFEGYCTDVWFDSALEFIEKKRSSPFFVYLTTNAPHGPYNVPQKYIDLYSGDDRVPNARFWGMITNIDENMGRLVAELERLELARDTILIFTTDNGTAAGFGGKKGFNAGMRGKKGSEYDGGHRVPFFVRWPGGGIGGGRDVPQLTAHFDVLPTLVDLCKLELPRRALDGRSFARLLRGDGADWHERALVVNSQRIEYPEKWRKSSVMTERWRLVNGTELYDIEADPGQLSDLAGEHPELRTRLREVYESWWKSVGRRFDDNSEIVVGSSRQNPAALTAHDWHEGSPPWNQSHIRSGTRSNGVWYIDVARTGRYEISLRRWPQESGLAIDAPGKKDVGVKPISARLRVGTREMTLPVVSGAQDVTFSMSLKKGVTTLQSWLTDAKGASRGAFYASVRFVGQG